MLLATSLPALAKGGKNPPPSISSVIVNTDDVEIQIFGSNFADPEVTLGPFIFSPPYLLSEPDELIIAIPPMVPGDYKLILTQNKDEVEWDLTTGAVGSEGPKGDTGPQGGVGPQGPQGADSTVAGPQGAQQQYRCGDGPARAWPSDSAGRR